MNIMPRQPAAEHLTGGFIHPVYCALGLPTKSVHLSLSGTHKSGKEHGYKMLRDITLGQYYQTDSVIHRLDPRVKLVTTVCYIVSLFVVDNFVGYILAGQSD